MAESRLSWPVSQYLFADTEETYFSKSLKTSA